MKPLDVIIENYEKVLLSATDILRLTDNQVNIVVYNELVNYKTIDEVFDGKQGIILLYQGENKNTGHWTLIYFTNRKTLYFFDSYGFQLDTEIPWSPFLKKQGYGKNPPLTALIKNSPYKLLQNKTKYQDLNNNKINTCGRWCITRFNYRHLTDKDFKTFMLGNKHYNGDFWVSILTA